MEGRIASAALAFSIRDGGGVRLIIDPRGNTSLYLLSCVVGKREQMREAAIQLCKGRIFVDAC